MLCELCKEQEANKSNTHYLTDAIIRSCLNQDGSSEREKGFYFDLSNKYSHIEFNFQRGTSIEKLTESLGRDATDDEIEKAKRIPYSVDKVFCDECEKIFSIIEGVFIKDILPSFRENSLNEISAKRFLQSKEIRLFFYIQIWRSHICDQVFSLPNNIAEELRSIIYNYKSVSLLEINHFPLMINYLQTLGGAKEYTSNYVGFSNDKNPYVIFMNDYIIQFYESQDHIKYDSFYGLNSEHNYLEYINLNEDDFIIKIVSNQSRKEVINSFVRKELVSNTITRYKESFIKLWYMTFGVYPSPKIINEFILVITGGGFDVLKYSKERIIDVTAKFVLSKL